MRVIHNRGSQRHEPPRVKKYRRDECERLFRSATLTLCSSIFARVPASLQREVPLHDLDLHVGLLTESELTKVLKMLQEIQDEHGIACKTAHEPADLEMRTDPDDVLVEIERRLQRSAPGRSKLPGRRWSFRTWY